MRERTGGISVDAHPAAPGTGGHVDHRQGEGLTVPQPEGAAEQAGGEDGGAHRAAGEDQSIRAQGQRLPARCSGGHGHRSGMLLDADHELPRPQRDRAAVGEGRDCIMGVEEHPPWAASEAGAAVAAVRQPIVASKGEGAGAGEPWAARR